MIEGFFEPYVSEAAAPYVMASVVLQDITDWALMPFLIDTGAARTVIHPRDAKELLGVPEEMLASPPRSWGSPASGFGVGGGGLYYEVAGIIGFRDGTGAPAMLQVLFGLAPLTTVTATLPSLLGRDVLQHFDLAISWQKRVVRLEPASPSG